MLPALLLLGLLAHPATGAGPGSWSRSIPAFARKYRTTCSTCHTAAPKLNVLGEAFRLNGYRFPDNDALLRQDRPVPLGEEPWKDLWPRAIWPSELPEAVPLALRIVNDLAAGRHRGGGKPARVEFRFPDEVALLGGVAFDEHLSAFLDTEWSDDEGVEVRQAKLLVQNPIPGLSRRLLNLAVGMQDQYLFTFAHGHLDRAARAPFRWQRFRVADLELRSGAGASLRSGDAFQLTHPQPALELNGLLGRRLGYGLGLAQGSAGPEDNNVAKDFYYRLRYKIGGLALDGTYPQGSQPVLARGGQLRDRSLTLEHFGYVGKEPTGFGDEERHRAFGANARWLEGPLDLGAGYVWGRHDRPWGGAGGSLTYRSVFGKAEVLVLPWLIGTLKAERFTVEPSARPVAGFEAVPADETRIIPGLIALVRSNIRWVVEGETFPHHAESAALGTARPTAVWMRLDFAF